MSSAFARIIVPEELTCIAVPLYCRLFVTCTTISSPQSAVIVGPGMVPLKDRVCLSYPSGARVVLSTDNQYSEENQKVNITFMKITT